jgi:hypothetical protein
MQRLKISLMVWLLSWQTVHAMPPDFAARQQHREQRIEQALQNGDISQGEAEGLRQRMRTRAILREAKKNACPAQASNINAVDCPSRRLFKWTRRRF